MTSANTDKPIAIYHVMRRRDGFEEVAGELWAMLHHAAREHPGVPRHLYMDIEGHTRKGTKDEYDDDATELIAFVRAALGPHLTKTPWGRTDESAPQSDDLPQVIVMAPASGDDQMVILTGQKDKPVRREPAPAKGDDAE